MTKIVRMGTGCCLAATILASAGCGGDGPSPKTEQAIGVGMVSVGTVVAPYCPQAGIPLVAVGAAVTVHGKVREESYDGN